MSVLGIGLKFNSEQRKGLLGGCTLVIKDTYHHVILLPFNINDQQSQSSRYID